MGIAEMSATAAALGPQKMGAEGKPSARIGIVVPVYNEAALLPAALERLQRIAGECPVVVVDGGSSDGSAEIAARYFPTEVLPRPNRGAQMNLGALLLQADVYLFLHIDTRLPEDFLARIEEALSDPRVSGGCFRLEFEQFSPWLWFYTFWTRFRGRYLHFGDQAYFVRREVFEELGGYRELPLMEDVDFLARLRHRGPWRRNRFAVIEEPVITSARRYLRYGIVRQQLLNVIMVTLFELGVPPRLLARLYPAVR